MCISFDDCSIVSWKIFCHMFTSYLPNSHEICISLEAFGQVHCTCCFGVYNLQHSNADQYHWQGNFEEPNLRKGNIKMFVSELQFGDIFMSKTFRLKKKWFLIPPKHGMAILNSIQLFYYWKSKKFSFSGHSKVF